MPKPIFTPLQRLLSKIAINEVSGCWVWTARCMKGGYGTFSIANKFWLAHRASWTLHKGPIPPNLDVLHRCDNPPCVNPDHLFLGNDFDNQQDRVRKGRHAGWPAQIKGFNNPSAKLTKAKVLEIRELYAARTLPQTKIAAQFGVSQPLVCLIGKRKVWADV